MTVASQSMSANKVHVSVRMPVDLSREIDDYAAAHSVNRTKAYERLIRLGLQAAKETQSDLEGKIDLILEMLGAGPRELTSKETVVSTIATVCSRFPQVERAWLFGSFARGEQGPSSDIDLRLELDRNTAFNLHDLEHLSKEIERLSGRPCDVVTARDIKNLPLKTAIDRDKELVYER